MPESNIGNLSATLQVQWLYMSYHHLDHAKYVESGKVLKVETLETLAAYFQAIHNQKVANGTLLWQKESTKRPDERHNQDKSRDSNSHRLSSRGQTYNRRHTD